MENKLKKNIIHSSMYISFIRGVPIGLTLDGVFISNYISSYLSPFLFQFLISFIAIHRFYEKFKNSTKRVKSFMKYAIFVGIILEIIAALILKMYTYRLENIPLYVPFGHALIYICAYYLSKEPLVKKYSKNIQLILLISAISYSLFWWCFTNDYFGMLCLFIFLIVFYFNKRSRIFMLFIFFLVVYVELIGTSVGAWTWAEITFFGMPSANPPSAIGIAYVLLDSICLFLYKKFNPLTWKRFKAIYNK